MWWWHLVQNQQLLRHVNLAAMSPPFAKAHLFAKTKLLLDALYYQIFSLLIREKKKARKLIFAFFRDISMHLTCLLVQTSFTHPLHSACHFLHSFSAQSHKLFTTWILGVFLACKCLFLTPGCSRSPLSALAFSSSWSVPSWVLACFQTFPFTLSGHILGFGFFQPFHKISSRWYSKKDQIMKNHLNGNMWYSKTTRHSELL